MPINKRSRLAPVALLGGLALAGLAVQPAAAESLTFAFGSLSNNATDAQIQSLMNSTLGGNGSVTITGAVGSNSYNADGHVTGPGSHGSYSSDTLATLDPTGNGTFIENDAAHSDNDILMNFSDLTIASVAFDFEIFPDDSCTALSSRDCGGHGDPDQPDLTLSANGSPVITWDGLTPGSGDNSNGVSASTYTHSPASGYNTETAPQLLGSSGVIDLPADTTTLDFQDWPATIAINDLVITFDKDPPPIPEPGTMALLGSALAGFALMWRRRRV
ncbi:MAG: PEP-CTERM sorting domain-containing protein [Stellaceae bacterium]